MLTERVLAFSNVYSNIPLYLDLLNRLALPSYTSNSLETCNRRTFLLLAISINTPLVICDGYVAFSPFLLYRSSAKVRNK